MTQFSAPIGSRIEDRADEALGFRIRPRRPRRRLDDLDVGGGEDGVEGGGELAVSVVDEEPEAW
jgi:hypothetical protein